MISKTLEQLRQECEFRKLVPQPSRTTKAGKKVFFKKDYVKVLQENSVSKRYPKGLPEHLRVMLSIESPMLCYRYGDLKEPEQVEVWNSDDWVFEEKISGFRMFLLFFEGKLRFCEPRTLSPITFLPTEYHCVWHQADQKAVGELFDSFVLDCEVTCVDPMIKMILNQRGIPADTHAQAVASLLSLRDSESIEIQKDGFPLYFHAFDVLKVNGQDITHLPLRRRRRGLRSITSILETAGLKIARTSVYEGSSLKKYAYDRILRTGGEGVVAKNLLSPYSASTSRKRDGWVKIKKAERCSLTDTILGDTLDGWVSGYQIGEDGLVKTLHISVQVRRFDGSTYDKVIAFLEDLPPDLRSSMTMNGPGNEPCLDPQFEERVAEIDGDGFSPRSRCLRKPRLVRWRDDKYRSLCVFEEESLGF